MATQENNSVIINTGSKQGITAPPLVPNPVYSELADSRLGGMLDTTSVKLQSRHIRNSVSAVYPTTDIQLIPM
jgi:hypothetical protein